MGGFGEWRDERSDEEVGVGERVEGVLIETPILSFG